MYTWMEGLVKRFPAVATLVKGGWSTEGRHILGVRIAHAADLPVIYVEAGIHGREWASSSAATYILDQLLTSADPAVAQAARSFEWHIFPSVNPDAHEYTHTTDRLWRKSRKPTTTLCTGADLNRNFPVSWGTVGVSWDFCSDLFPGTRAASEVETRTRMAYMEDLLPRMKAFVALHSFGQFLLLPWGFTPAEPRDHQGLVAVASKTAEAFARPHGTPLTIGSIAKVLYPASGASMDWAHSRGVPFTYTFELRDRGNYGFLLPASEILPASEEALAGVVGMADAVLQRLAKP
ncbi:hypothetical protein ONE63_001472 [Megalurothrips usitatus]|uniref:Peptidase M14 domain-containing protein n=1 Tax=Megalurothrips usitatus TaxID=439358 RepID=A0AAV7XFB7_9NEOP|nr:hypothetical protein ONE63_001472 [Megalurothrips usitatus]